jgi:hypothetical protein
MRVGPARSGGAAATPPSAPAAPLVGGLRSGGLKVVGLPVRDLYVVGRPIGRRLVGGLRGGLLVGLVVGLVGGCGAGGAAARSSAPTTPPAAGSAGETPPPHAPGTVVVTATPRLSNAENATETAAGCPYITASAFSDLEGDRVGRFAVLRSEPVGCRFYFDGAFGDATVVVGEVFQSVFATPTAAFNAMVSSATGHPEVQSSRTIGDGAVLFRSLLQGRRTWQCVFASGSRVFTVRTRQGNTSADAANIAAVVVRNTR